MIIPVILFIHKSLRKLILLRNKLTRKLNVNHHVAAPIKIPNTKKIVDKVVDSFVTNLNPANTPPKTKRVIGFEIVKKKTLTMSPQTLGFDLLCFLSCFAGFVKNTFTPMYKRKMLPKIRRCN